MEVYVEKNSTYVSAFKVLLAAAAPAQRLIQSPVLTHFMINRHARLILKTDGYVKTAEMVERYSEEIDRGVSWADDGFKNMAHFLNPNTEKGLYGWTNGIIECNLFWNKAIENWRTGNREKAFFYLGASIHLVQDLCVPHHAMGVLFDGHQDYEDWVKNHKYNYGIEKGGIYDLGFRPEDWIKPSLSIARNLYPFVKAGSSARDYNIATSLLLPWVQKISAGFLNHFVSWTETI